MRRKLLLLNVALALLLVYAGHQLRQTYQFARARERATLAHRTPPVAAPPFTPMPPSPPVVAGGYSEIVQQTLFDKSRNPEVPVELPPPPPPKPLPPLPVFHGMMNLGDGVTVVLSENATAPHQGIRRGESIGQFKLVDVNTQEITLEWDGQTITRKLDQLEDQAAAPAAAPPSSAGARTEQPAPAAAAVTPRALGPGMEIGPGARACQPNDSYADGAIVDGFRKTVLPSPFGPMCRWDAAR